MEKRHAYLILAHKNFGQLRKLVELLDDPRNDIFIHVDGRADFDPAGWDKVCGYSALKFLEHRYMVHWGGVSIMRSELALLKEAASHGHYAYYHLLSGMDLPIKDQDTVHAFFERNSGSEFLNLWRMRKNNYWRFNYWAPFPEGGGVPMLNFLNNVCKAMQKELAASASIPEEMAAYQGRLGESAKTLLAYLNRLEEVNFLSDKLFVYTMLRADEDTADSTHQAMKGKCFSFLVSLSSAMAFEGPELVAIPDETLDAFYAQEPGLTKYRRYLTKARLGKPHILSQAEEKLLRTLTGYSALTNFTVLISRGIS